MKTKPIAKKKVFKPSPLMLALKRYLATANLDSSTLGAPSKDNRYLRNRIEAAFIAGWDFAVDSTP